MSVFGLLLYNQAQQYTEKVNSTKKLKTEFFYERGRGEVCLEIAGP
jgi:hypothetical protein